VNHSEGVGICFPKCGFQLYLRDEGSREHLPNSRKKQRLAQKMRLATHGDARLTT